MDSTQTVVLVWHMLCGHSTCQDYNDPTEGIGNNPNIRDIILGRIWASKFADSAKNSSLRLDTFSDHLISCMTLYFLRNFFCRTTWTKGKHTLPNNEGLTTSRATNLRPVKVRTKAALCHCGQCSKIRQKLETKSQQIRDRKSGQVAGGWQCWFLAQ